MTTPKCQVCGTEMKEKIVEYPEGTAYLFYCPREPHSLTEFGYSPTEVNHKLREWRKGETHR